MPDVVNLNRFRKAKRRQDAEQKAEKNRSAFGQSKSQRQADAKKIADREKFLDQHRLGGDADSGAVNEPAHPVENKSEPQSGAGQSGTDTEPAKVIKRSMAIAGHQTSISLEDIFWDNLKTIAAEKKQSVAGLVAEIDATRKDANLSSAIRVFILKTITANNQPPNK